MRIILAYFDDVSGIAGGLQKSLCQMANALVARGHEVLLAVYDRGEGQFWYPLDEGVALRNFRRGAWTGLDQLAREARRLVGGKHAVRRWKRQWKHRHGLADFGAAAMAFGGEVIVSFQALTTAEILAQQVPIPVVSSLRNDLAARWGDYLPEERDALARSAAIHVLLPAYGETVERCVPGVPITPIPNVIEPAREALLGEKDRYRILFVGRLVMGQKRPDLLVRAFAGLAERHPDWTVECYGGGTPREERALADLVRALHMEERIRFCGVTRDVEHVLAAGDLFAFPSAFEGFPHALGEAMAAGLPVAACLDCAASRSLITDGVTGLLTDPDAAAYASALEALMDDGARREALGVAARQAVAAYAPDAVWGRWEAFLRDVAGQKGNTAQFLW